MDTLDAMRVFARVVERRSFTLAAEDIGLPRSTVTNAVQQLEARLGTGLLQRTTRHVSPTLDGEAYYQRCLAILADIEDAEGAFAGQNRKGRCGWMCTVRWPGTSFCPDCRHSCRPIPGYSFI